MRVMTVLEVRPRSRETRACVMVLLRRAAACAALSKEAS